MTIQLTYDEAVELLDRAVAEKGADYVYEQTPVDDHGGTLCAYFTTVGAPSCIVGHVLAYKGVTRDGIASWDDTDLNYDAPVHELVQHEFISVDEQTERLLTVAQTHQDKQVPWGAAVTSAKHAAAALTGADERVWI